MCSHVMLRINSARARTYVIIWEKCFKNTFRSATRNECFCLLFFFRWHGRVLKSRRYHRTFTQIRLFSPPSPISSPPPAVTTSTLFIEESEEELPPSRENDDQDERERAQNEKQFLTDAISIVRRLEKPAVVECDDRHDHR